MAGTDFSHLTNDELINGIKVLDLPDYIRSKAYGIDVRETLAQMTEMTIQLGINMGLSPDEALSWVRKLQDIEAQLAQKTTKGEVNINHFDEPTRQTFLEAQGIDVNYVLGLGNVKPENTSFFEIGKNMFDKANVISGKYVSSTSGKLVDSETYNATDYIGVLPNTTYTSSVFYHGAIYDGDKNFISAIPDKVAGTIGKTFETPANGHFIRLSLRPVDMNTLQIEEGSASTTYTEYFQHIPLEHIEPLKPNMITPLETTFAEYSPNLFDMNAISEGYYVSQTSGNLIESENYWASEPIRVEPNQDYSLSEVHSATRIAYFDENKQFILGILQPDNTINTPMGANSIIISNSSPNIKPDRFQFEKGTTPTPYQPYGVKIKDFILPTQEHQKININLPTTLYALVGEEFNVYFDNIIDGRDVDFDFDVTCSIGAQYQNFYRLTASEVGSYDFKIDVYKNHHLVSSKEATIKVSSKSAGSGVNLSILKIGDSTTDNGKGVIKLNENFSTDVMDITCIGTRGTSPNLHEGRSGWTATRYTTEDNAFLNPSTNQFDFNYYLTSNGFDVPDVVFINLGINDMFHSYNDSEATIAVENALSKYQEMIDSIKSVSEPPKVALGVTIPPNYSQDAFGKSYGTNQTRTRYKRNNALWVKSLIENFDKRISEGIYLVPINVNLDTRYNMGLEEIQVNARNTTTYMSPIGNGGVHPDESGYWQIADIEWYFLKSLY